MTAGQWRSSALTAGWLYHCRLTAFLTHFSAFLRNILKIAAYYSAIRNTDLRIANDRLYSCRGYTVAINRNPKRRAAGVASTKIVIASASIAATLGGWAAIGAMDTTSTAASAAQNGPLAQAPAQQPQGTQQDSQPNATTPFGRHNRRGGQGLPFPAPNGESGGFGGGAPQTLPQGGDQQQQQPEQLPGTNDPQTQLPQAQPQQQPQFQTQPRARTRSSR